MNPAFPNDRARIDFALIAEMVAPGARVLDIGCGDGALLELLKTGKNCQGRGLEISQTGVNKSVARGLSVIQGDADTDLAEYPASAFDYVILSQTLQATHRPLEVLDHMMRIGEKAIVSFPNFGHWRMRAQLVLKGRMPNTETLSYPWHSTPNIHLCTVRDFEELVAAQSYRIEREVMVSVEGKARDVPTGTRTANLFADQAIFLLTR